MINSIGDLDYSGLYTLHVYDSDYSENVNWIDIAVEMLEKESLETNLLLSRLSTATIGDIQTIEPFKELKSDVENAGGQITLDGTIHVTGSWSTVEIDTYENTWSGLTFDVSEGT